LSHGQELQVLLPGELAPFQGDGGTRGCVRLPVFCRFECGLGSGLVEGRGPEVGGGVATLEGSGVDFGAPGKECVEGSGLGPKQGDIGQDFRDQVVQRN